MTQQSATRSTVGPALHASPSSTPSRPAPRPPVRPSETTGEPLADVGRHNVDTVMIPSASGLNVLSRRWNANVLALMAAGCTNRAIAERLVVGIGAVEKHVANIFTKLQLHATTADHRRVLAVVLYLNARDDATTPP